MRSDRPRTRHGVHNRPDHTEDQPTRKAQKQPSDRIHGEVTEGQPVQDNDNDVEADDHEQVRAIQRSVTAWHGSWYQGEQQRGPGTAMP